MHSFSPAGGACYTGYDVDHYPSWLHRFDGLPYLLHARRWIYRVNEAA